jgi:rod shape-determining protein MreB
MAGGGSLLRGLDRLFAEEIGMQATLTNDPLGTVALGIGQALEELDTLKSVFITGRKSSARMRGIASPH